VAPGNTKEENEMREEVLKELNDIWLELNGINARLVLFVKDREEELENRSGKIVLFPKAGKEDPLFLPGRKIEP
jgi:hypothetical protein